MCNIRGVLIPTAVSLPGQLGARLGDLEERHERGPVN